MMKPTSRNWIEWASKRKRLDDAAACAEEIFRVSAPTERPVDPLRIAESEKSQLSVCCGDYRDRFDGQLEYHPGKGRFILFYNTKYDETPGIHAPRTRFSIAHELGHYFLEAHHEYLRRGNPTHGSKSGFISDQMVEREADTFAAHLLMPKVLFEPEVNQDELTLGRIGCLAQQFMTSFSSTAIRAVTCSDWPCAVAGLRDGEVAWMFCSQPLIEAGFFPRGRQPLPTDSARKAYTAMSGPTDPAAAWATDWFNSYRDTNRRVSVLEQLQPVRSMNTTVALLTIPEDELAEGD